MSFQIKTMNKISSKGLGLFGNKYEISENYETPNAIVVRSAKVDTDAFSGLLAVARAGAGTNNVTVDKATEKGICVFNAPGANANAVCELVFSALGMALRNLHKSVEYSTSLKDWTDDAALDVEVEKNKSRFVGSEMIGRTMAIVGLGKIGVLVANAAVARGMKVVAYEPFPSVGNMHQLHHSVAYYNELAQVLPDADFVSVHVPLLDSTRGLFNSSMISNMKDGAYLLNFSRGPVVDTDSAVEAMESGKLASYICDFPSNALLNCSKAICTPHLGASTEEAEENCAIMVVEQVKEYLEYGIVRNSVNFPAVGNVPSHNIKTRVIVIHKDVPNMISDITKAFGDAGINIQSFKNESNNKVGYSIIDLTASSNDAVIKTLEAHANVLKVRVINF